MYKNIHFFDTYKHTLQEIVVKNTRLKPACTQMLY